jgi:competence protein ComEC
LGQGPSVRGVAARGAARLSQVLDRQAPNLPLWIPVLFGVGVAVYFALPVEPPGWLLVAACGPILVALATAPLLGPRGRVIVFLIAPPLLGFADAGLRTRMVAAPVLDRERTVAVEGRVADLSRSGSDRPRVLLDEVWIAGMDPAATPATVRISLDPGTDPAILEPGRRLAVTARLSPPSGPTEPGGFDFRFNAFFERLGAVGYTRTPMLEVEGSETSLLSQAAFRARVALSRRIQGRVPGQDGAFGAAILAGDRSALSREVDKALRISTLYHLVSISGLHMSLLAAAIFAIVRYGLALVPWCALRWPLKKIAAVAALIGGGAYLVISGGEVATQRAYVMTAVVLGAVLLDRPALTARSIALAALIVLVAAPEALPQPGFQMSFSATIALVAGFEALRARPWWRATQTDRRWRFAKPVLGVAMTSLIAGLASGPISAFHFNTASPYGLLANVLAVPMMGLVVMPAAVVGVAAIPFGLDALPFTIMGWGIAYVLAVATYVSGLGGAVAGVPAGPPAALALLCLGGLFIVLWRGAGRWFGLAPMALALGLWTSASRPAVLIAENGRLFGVMTAEGRALSTDRGGAFLAANWLAKDGDRASQEEAASRGDIRRSRARIEAEVPGLGTILYVGSKDPAGAAADCAGAAILIAPKWPPPEGPCLFIDAETLRREGVLAIDVVDGRPVVTGALPEAGRRPWTASGSAEPARREPPSGQGLTASVAMEE